ncbi:hypothetical protein [Agrobacterium leguminum]|uniref:hypothetical protein n=1 Tax=Agrobacterium leguminum TaxID=2792015 RepID=UPI0022B81D10|nr:hypothetical protein [Agrobacterium leguminum]
MVLMILVGALLLCVFSLLGKLWSGDLTGVALAARFFIPVWLVIATVNLWVGVTKAGYSVREELPILFVVFAVPAALAGVAIWRLAR